MEKKIKNFIQQNQLIIRQPIICAVSGGVDSVTLLHLLHKLGYSVVLAHVNHHKRIESEIEQEAMKALAKKLEIPFELCSYHYSHSDNFHNEAHKARYDFFKSLCKKYNTDTIVTAHHLNDQLETILMKVMEGSNLYGYGGISVINSYDNIRIIRPLLCVSKKEILAYAENQKLVFYEDSSNGENTYLRNRIRHHIVPLIEEECEDIYDKVYQYSTQVKEAFHFLRVQSIDYLKLSNNKIDIPRFNPLDIALRKDILSLLLEKYAIRKNYRLIMDMLKSLDSFEGTKTLKLADGYVWIRSYDCAYITKLKEEWNPISVSLGDVVEYGNRYKFYFSKKIPTTNAKYIKLWYNNLELPFIIRPKKDGDVIELSIGNKKVNRIFIDYKVPAIQRKEIPIILNQKNEILWVYDLAKSDSVYKQKNTGDIYFVCEEI